MESKVAAFVKAYVEEHCGKASDLDRLVTTASGLSREQMIEAISHPDMGRLGITLMADLMAPEGSLYYDAIFGAYTGQLAIRRWLVPAMAEIEFIDFVPTAPAIMFDDGQGGTSLDEWQMVMNLEGQQIPLSLGVSVRRYRDGWITWACDVYDTAAFRQPPPAEMDAPAPPPLPPVPQVEWATDATIVPATLADPRRLHAPLHPTESVYVDPVAGALHGSESINHWIDAALAAAADSTFQPLGPLVTDGSTSVQEWKQSIRRADATISVVRGTSVRRVADGLVVYAADYYDTASLPGAEPAPVGGLSM